MSSLRIARIQWLASTMFLLWTTRIVICQAMSTIHTVNLNMNGTLYVTNHSQDTVNAIVCRVTHNSTNRSVFFHINGTELDGTSSFQIDKTIRVERYEQCFDQPSSDACTELVLVFRAVPELNNSRFFCRARVRDRDSDMRKLDSRETVTVVLKDPDVEETPEPTYCSPSPSPSPSTTPSPSPSLSPSPHPPSTTSPPPVSPAVSPLSSPTTPDPEVDTTTNQFGGVLPEGRERWYVGALAGVVVFLIASVLLNLFLLCCVCKKTTNKYKFPQDPECAEPSHTKATFSPSLELNSSNHDSKEPRYVECISDV